MAYLAIARRWRPSQFDDLVGQSHVVQTLKNAIRLNRVSHAYLFCGARGIGKTSVARIFAKALRCPNAKDASSCNECAECLAISESRSVDVVEIDGASNNGVEAVRSIRENVVYGAATGKYKIYIIDEVHMLSLSAFNALLKTLEEPPEHVVFIFATTEAQKIPLTIVSRCQRFEFRRLTNSQIVGRLQQILAAEKILLSEEGLRAMAAHSDGSLRDALSLLDQVLSYYGQKGAQESALTEKQVVEALGVNESSTIRNFLWLILRKDIPGIISLVGDTYLSGVDLKHFSEQLLEEIRLLYLVALGKQTGQTLTADTLDISASHFAELTELSKINVLQIERMSQIVTKAISQLGWSSLPRFVLEVAAVRMTKLSELEEMEAALLRLPTAPEAQQPTAPPRATGEPRPKIVAAPPPPPPSDEDIYEGPPAPSHSSVPMPGAPTEMSWKGFVDMVMKKRPLLGALLSHGNFRLETKEGKQHIHLAFPPGSFYERQASDSKGRSEIEEHVRNYFGEKAQLNLSTDLENTSRSLEEERRIEEASIRKEAVEHPMVLQMKEALGAEIVDVNIESQPESRT